MRQFLLIISLLLIYELNLRAQNLVPNPSFETYTTCPLAVNIDIPMECIPWTAGTTGTCDYFNSCGPWLPVGVPKNFFGYQYAYSGQAYCGFYAREFTPLGDYREYVQAPLISPLAAGVSYYVSFYVSVANHFCGTDLLGAYFSVGPPPYNLAFPLTFTPQVQSNTGFLSDTSNWMLVQGCFTAIGGENYITIGNFRSNADTPIDPVCMNNWVESYYYIDEVYVGEIEPTDLDFDLGGPVTACYEYEIDPGLTDVNYLWEDGSTGPTLLVTESGTYSVTVYKNCEEGEDSIEVILIDDPPIELNPDDTLFCAGESLTFNLNSAAGDYEWSDGSNASNYTITETGFYEVTFDDGCDITTDDIFVSVVDPPAPFSLGGDTTICVGADIVFNFDPDLGDFLWQDNSTSNSYIISQSGEYALTISNLCGQESAEMLVDEEMPAVINIGPALDTLCSGEFLDITLDPFLGNYVWQDGSTSSNYHISSPGIYSVTLTQLCGQSSDSVIVMALAMPSFNLGDTLSACPGDTLILAAIGVTGNYLWQDGSVNDSLSVTSAGTYALTISNACGSVNDSVVVMYENALTPPDLGPDFSLCPGQQALLSPGIGNVNYLWQDLSTADTFLITDPGTYYVRISNACSSATDTVIVSLNNNPPFIALPDQLSLCEGSTTTLDPGVTGVNFMWSDGSQDPTLTISSSGNYSLTVSNTCGADVDTVHVLDGGPLPTVSLGTDTSLCAGQSIVLNPSFSNVDNWLWNDGSTSSNYVASDSGSINIAVNNACGVAYDTIEIGLLLAPPNLNLGMDTSLCPGESVTLSILISNVDIQWSDGSVNPDLLINSAGTYFASISNMCGVSNDTIVVDALPAVPALDLGADLPLCPGESLTIAPGIPDVDYLWQDGSMDTFFVADHNQTVSLIISNACGSSTDALDIFTSTNGPDVELGPDVLACEGEVVTINSNISGVNYWWQDGSTNSSFATTTSGIYSLQVSNACGTDIDSIVVDIHGTTPDPVLGPDTVLCEGNSLILTSNTDTETTTSWQNGSTLLTFEVNAPGTYILTQANHCGEKKDSINISYQSLPVDINLGPDTILCPGATLLLNAPQTSDYIEWQDGSNAQNFLATQAGTYSLRVSNNCGMKTDELLLAYDDKLPQFTIEDEIALCTGESILLDATQLFDATYLWNTGSTSPTITVTTPDEYAVTVTTNCNEASDDVTIFIDPACASTNDIYIPNVISPNGDNVNDVFTLFFNEDIEIISINGSIFDRWGDLVFSSTSIPFVWDGKFGDQEVNPAVFVYTIDVVYKVNTKEIKEKFVGDVTVIK